MTTSFFSRRHALGGLAASGVMMAAAKAEAAQALPADACMLTPQSVEGPYYIDPKLVREDITEGLPGVPLHMRLRVLGEDCRPVTGARAEIWHADAIGRYSGYERQGDAEVSTVGQTFLRGAQMTDGEGEVTFRTIWPGWYQGRTPHIHMKIFLDARNVLTGQIYFPDALSEFIYTHIPPYTTRRGKRDTINRTDGILQMAGRDGSLCAVREEADHYAALLTVGVSPRGQPLTGGPGGPPPGGFPGGPPGRMGPPPDAAFPGGRPPGPPPGGTAGGPPPPGGPGPRRAASWTDAELVPSAKGRGTR